MHFSNWQNKLTAFWLLLVAIVAISMATMWFNKNIHIQSNIFALLPQISDNPKLLQSYDKVSEQINHKVFVMLQTQDEAQLNQATQQLLQQATGSQLWQPIQPSLDVDQFGQMLFQYRTGLLSQEDRELLLQQDYAALTEKSMLQLLSPGVPITAQMLQQDPLLLFPRYLLEKSQHNQQNIELEQGWATLREPLDNGQTQLSRLIVLELRQSTYQIDNQQQTLAWIQQQTAQLQQAHVQATWTGTLLFASAGTQSAQKEISTIGVGSSIGIVLLVLFGFRSLRPLLTEFIAVSTGSLIAFAVTHWIFGEIHLMTLVFGASLIGVCVDFSFYFMAMQSISHEKNGFRILMPLLPSLFMGLMTTIIAYFFLSFTPFPAFKQISVFSMVGLFSAWLTTVLLLPRLPALNAKPALKRLHFLGEIRNKIVIYPKRRYAMIAVIVLFSLAGLSQVRFNDDIHNLQSADVTLKQADQNIRQRFGQQQGNDYFIVTGSTAEHVVQQEQQLLERLQLLQQQGKIEQIQAIGQWLNPALQQQNVELLQAIPHTILIDYAEAMGLSVADTLKWQQQLAQQSQLTMQQFAQHPLAQLAISDHERVVLLQGIQDRQALGQLQNEYVYFMQPVQTLSEQFALHRQHAQWLLLAAIVTLAVILGMLYGRKSVLELMLPVSMALACTFAIQAYLGIELNLFSIMATFLILGIGVDYAIFYRHAEQHSFVVAMALFLCMLSTLLGFGLLALSNTYAIFCFGMTVLIGVILSFVFATCLTQTELPK
ncbi:bifunctional glycerol-3-phosphate dehydrogenase/glycerol-3-phosphate acyltransferase [Acinetobacter puyangensis]|uniref:Predicted exporter n=1 Tax=Acinetobacter puyangensis TaxID=1096779 RepID=A0A240E5U5_9GAMM|nr:hypothetical protein [Acinetobacter puyangensis]SNX43245.1 Predicted exporter [Acinetobacter puyangensis]